MANAARIRVEWAGVVGPGVSTFYSEEADAAAAYAAVRTFFDAIKTLLVPSVTLTFPNTGDLIDVGTGQISGSWSATSAGSVTGTATTVMRAAGVGAFVRWETGGIINGRRVRGRTFITEVSTGFYESNGTLTSGSITTLQSAAQTLASSGLIAIYSRLPGGGGALSGVSSASVPDRVTSLRSRRF